MTTSTECEWVDLVPLSALEPNDVTPVHYRGNLLAVYDTRDGISVSDAGCTHAGANLCDGYFDGRYIECPLHQGLFDAITGEAKAAPVVRALRMHECRVKNAMLQLREAVVVGPDQVDNSGS